MGRPPGSKNKPPSPAPGQFANPPAVQTRDDPISDIRADMEKMGANKEHALASVPQSVYLNPGVAQVRLLQSMNLPAENLADFVIATHDGIYHPSNRPTNFPPTAAPVYDDDAPTRLAVLVGLTGWSRDGMMVNHVVSFGQNIFSLLGRAFRRRNAREAHSEIASSDDDMDEGRI